MLISEKLNDPKLQRYKVLAKDPTTTNNDLVDQTINRLTKTQLINGNISNWLKNPSTRIPQLHMSPKIHKERNLGCPEVSSLNCHTTNISKYVDYQLQTIEKQIPSNVKDTNKFIKKINVVKSLLKNS